MSNEYKEWRNDIMAILNVKMRLADLLPDGWTSTFIPALKMELANVLGSYVEDFMVLDIKEKYGIMRMYWNWEHRNYTEEESEDLRELTYKIEDILAKYEQISEKTCVVCGKEATMMATGWVMPVCTEHEYL